MTFSRKPKKRLPSMTRNILRQRQRLCLCLYPYLYLYLCLRLTMERSRQRYLVLAFSNILPQEGKILRSLLLFLMARRDHYLTFLSELRPIYNSISLFFRTRLGALTQYRRYCACSKVLFNFGNMKQAIP